MLFDPVLLRARGFARYIVPKLRSYVSDKCSSRAVILSGCTWQCNSTHLNITNTNKVNKVISSRGFSTGVPTSFPILDGGLKVNNLIRPKFNATQNLGQYLFLQKKELSNESKEKREKIWTFPNALSITRIAMTPGIGYFIMTGDYTTALILTGLAGLTDLLDGFIARQFPSQASVFGSVIDPAADKILVSTLVVTLAATDLLPVWLCLLIIFRDAGLIIGVSRLRFKTLKPPITLRRFFDVGLPTVQLKPTFISKVNTLLQLGLVWCSLAAPVFDFTASPFLPYLHYLVATTTAFTAVDYLNRSGTFRIIKDS